MQAAGDRGAASPQTPAGVADAETPHTSVAGQTAALASASIPLLTWPAGGSGTAPRQGLRKTAAAAAAAAEGAGGSSAGARRRSATGVAKTGGKGGSAFKVPRRIMTPVRPLALQQVSRA